LEVTYKNNKIRVVCIDAKVTERQYGRKMAEKIHQRIDEISAADTVEMMVRFHIGRCHPLSQNRKGQFAVDLVHPYRLIFQITEKEVQIANIQEITDYQWTKKTETKQKRRHELWREVEVILRPHLELLFESSLRIEV